MSDADDSGNTPDPRFEVVWEWESSKDGIETTKFSRVYETAACDNLVGYVIRDFVDEETPHGNWDGSHRYDIPADEMPEVGNASDIAQMNSEGMS